MRLPAASNFSCMVGVKQIQSCFIHCDWEVDQSLLYRQAHRMLASPNSTKARFHRQPTQENASRQSARLVQTVILETISSRMRPIGELRKRCKASFDIAGIAVRTEQVRANRDGVGYRVGADFWPSPNRNRRPIAWPTQTRHHQDGDSLGKSIPSANRWE